MIQALSFTDRIWNGYKNVIPEAEEKYLEGQIDIIAFASVLYSQKIKYENRQKLLFLVDDLLKYADVKIFHGENNLQTTNAAETLSAILVWIALQKDDGSDEQNKGIKYAWNLCLQGQNSFRWLSDDDKYAYYHTYSMLKLTSAYITLLTSTNDVTVGLKSVENEIKNISNYLQKNRVYRKLGYLYRKNTWTTYFVGWKYTFKAIFQKDIPNAVRLKSFASIFGFN